MVLTVRDISEVDSALEEIRNTYPNAALILRELYAPHRAVVLNEWMTTGQVAKFFGVTKQTVRNWVDAGWLTARRSSRFGRRMIDAGTLADVARFRSARDQFAGSSPAVTEEQAAEALRALRADARRTQMGGGTR